MKYKQAKENNKKKNEKEKWIIILLETGKYKHVSRV